MLTQCQNATPYRVSEELRLMSYNVYYSDLREERMQLIVDEINQHTPDIMGLQEVVDGTWKNFLLDKIGDVYACVGHGREEGGVGEGTPIFYRKDKFTLIEENTFWLSDTPTVCSRYPSSRQNRIFTYAILSRNSDGKKIAVVNTHLDTKSAEGRLLQIASLKRQIAELGLDKYPIFITGDMNADRLSPNKEIDQLLNAGYRDSMEMAFHRSAQIATIDFILVQPEYALVTNYFIDTERTGGANADDHDPVIADVRLK
jgi:endonuclease/exonuclease/phosphatase family metal-dependent hydrolase